MQDLTTGTEQQISFGPGNDVLPSFAPDSYFIAFTSNRSGPNQIYPDDPSRRRREEGPHGQRRRLRSPAGARFPVSRA